MMRNTLLLASADKTIILWDVKAQKQMARLEGHTSSVNSIHFSHDAKLLASGSADKTIILWDVKTQTQVARSLTGHTNWVYSVHFSSR